MAEDNTQEESKLLSKHDFYFEAPLYEVVALEELEENTFAGDVDAYSAKNSTDTTYSIYSDSIDTWGIRAGSNYTNAGFYLVTLTCKRKDNDVLRFIVYKDNKITFKIGQLPSLADLQFSEIGKKYNKVLPEEDLKNLKKAIGLVANGIGAGSFVYLRRIFENLILETYQNNRDSLKLNETDFKRQRMEEKVDSLKEFLPSQLTEMKSVYGILSKGVHELSEEECLKHFAPVKLSIELILDQKIENKEKLDRDALVKKQLQDIHQQIKRNN